MTPSELALWTAVMRRAGAVTPEIAAKIIAAFQILRDNLTDAEFEKAVNLGYAEQIAAQILSDATFQAAMQPVRDAIRRSMVQSVTYYARSIPLPPVSKTVGIAFDYLSPNVIDAIRGLETKVITALEESTRETVRAIIENGLRDGVNPRTVAQDLRSMIGLGPTQAQEVVNFREALQGANGRSITDYTLRNRTVDRLLAKGELTPEQVERYTEIYRKRRIAQNAETTARTAALDAQKLANRLAWQNAVDHGIVDGDRLMKQRIGVDDDRERPEHVAINNEIRRFDEPYSNGEVVSGDSSWNCRCIDRYFVARA
jgi:hypothetical protein